MKHRMKHRKVLLVLAAFAAATLSLVTAAEAAPAPTPAHTRYGGAVVEDITFAVPGQFNTVHAWLVRPDGPPIPHSHAGVLFLHWLGDLNSDRGEYLPGAIALAQRGSVSLLPDGVFPWTGVGGPVGTDADLTAVRDQQAAFQGALNVLAARPDVDPARLGLVGHDYGAMFGSLLIDGDPRVKAAVLEAPDATWGNWFVKYFGLGLGDAQAAAYAASFAPLDPVQHLKRLGNALLVQFADRDPYIDATQRAAISAAAPGATVTLYHGQHQLTDHAKADRDAFLAARLGLGAS
jgi:dienelactone hydrolase